MRRPAPPRLTDLPLPRHAFVPGETPRHAAGEHPYAQGTRQPPAWLPDQWPTLTPYLYGIDLYNRGFWWEAHEAWEELWHAAGRSGDPASFLQGLIHLAASALNLRRGRPGGARRQAIKALRRLAGPGARHASYMGVDLPALIEEVRAALRSQLFDLPEPSRASTPADARFPPPLLVELPPDVAHPGASATDPNHGSP